MVTTGVSVPQTIYNQIVMYLKKILSHKLCLFQPKIEHHNMYKIIPKSMLRMYSRFIVGSCVDPENLGYIVIVLELMFC